MMTRILLESMNRVVFTQMNKINPNMSARHGSRGSCSVYAFNHVGLYQGLQHVCFRNVNTFTCLKRVVHSEKEAFIPFQIDHDMIFMTVFLSILNLIEFYLLQMKLVQQFSFRF